MNQKDKIERDTFQIGKNYNQLRAHDFNYFLGKKPKNSKLGYTSKSMNNIRLTNQSCWPEKGEKEKNKRLLENNALFNPYNNVKMNDLVNIDFNIGNNNQKKIGEEFNRIKKVNFGGYTQNQKLKNCLQQKQKLKMKEIKILIILTIMIPIQILL